MIAATTLQFLQQLKKNNNKDWFDKNRPAYEEAKINFLSFSQQLINAVAQFDTTIAQAHLEAKQCMSRLNRDIRFSKDKTPYKTNLFLMISQGGKKSNYACYYLQLQPGNTFSGGGVYMPPSADLQKFRQEIDYNFAEWKTIIHNKTFKKVFENGVQSAETLIRPPKGFEPTNPAIDFLKMKGFFTTNQFTDLQLQSASIIKRIAKTFETVKPMINFLNRAL
jgi:uncharacterized protein (TIGR02453 family)